MTYQDRVAHWLIKCFGREIAQNKQERNYRFLEEALELVQSLGLTESEAIELVGYVYNRSEGEPFQELGGVVVTLAALCFTQGMTMEDAGEIELARCWEKMERIREKHAAKELRTPLPGQIV